jgi:SAM-dependent methyltransferase
MVGSNLMPQDALTALDYTGSQYYDEHKAVGLDYLGHGYWHQSYARMVTEATLQDTYDRPFFFDAGCACGSILNGFKDTDRFVKVMGVDLSSHMVELGRKHFGFSDTEIIHGSIDKTGLPDGTVTLLHSSQVLEHIPHDLVPAVLDEFARILAPGGRAFLGFVAIREGETREMYMGDPTHVNVQPVAYWTKHLQSRGLLFDVEAYNRFVRSEYGPAEGVSISFYHYYPSWSVWTLIKDGPKPHRRYRSIEGELAAVYGSTSWRVTTPLRALGNVLRGRNGTHAMNDAPKSYRSLHAELAAVYGSTSWRVTVPLRALDNALRARIGPKDGGAAPGA